MPLSQLELDAVRRSPNNKVLIDLENGPVIQSWLAEDFGYSLGNSWDSFFESVGERMSGIANATGAAGNGLGIGAVAQMQVRNVGSTVIQWTGSERPAFQLSLFFIALRPNDDVRGPIRDLQKMVLPTIGKDLVLGQVWKAPNNLRWNPGVFTSDSINGGCGLKIGQWFATPAVLAVSKLNPVFSKATTKKGLPLYAACQIQLEAFRMMSADEVNSWFVEPVGVTGDFYGERDRNPKAPF